MLLMPGFETVSLLLFAAALVSYPVGGRLRARSWWHVSWRAQKTAVEPLWIPVTADVVTFALIALLVIIVGSFGTIALLSAGALVAYLAGGQAMLHLFILRHPESSVRSRRMNLVRTSVFAAGLVAIIATALVTARPTEPSPGGFWLLIYVAAMVFGIVVQHFTSGLRGTLPSAPKGEEIVAMAPGTSENR
ncbi:hypothetical protein [Plantibacter flavus]|nr:hypothetical protein [Plantibacter flavus]